MFVVKSDDKGLYVQCGGWIGRPPTQGTKAIKEMKVRATHPAGGTIYVRFEPRGKPECWWIEGLSKEARRVMDRMRGVK